MINLFSWLAATLFRNRDVYLTEYSNIFLALTGPTLMLGEGEGIGSPSATGHDPPEKRV